MTARVTAITAGARGGKTERVLALYRRALARQVPGSALWLAPTWRSAAAVRDRLLGSPLAACFSPGVTTFAKFAGEVLQSSPNPVRPLDERLKRQLVRRLLDDQLAAGSLRYFRPIAGTAGLVDRICDFIREMKQLDIWPERLREACRSRGMRQKDEELLAIYDAYQECLTEHNLYDAEGRFWSARELLRAGSKRPYQQLRLVVVDGFTDFTPPQHEIFQILAGQVEELWITLPLESGSDREDLFSKPRGTLALLRRWHPGLVIEQLDRPESTTWPAMDHLERTIFLNPRRSQPTDDTAGLEILAASRQLGEIELIGSRIKRLLCSSPDGAGSQAVRPGDVAVVFRSLPEVHSLVCEVFGKLGIPFVIESGQSLERSPVLSALASLIRLDVEDWPFRDLLAVLSGSYFQPDWPEWHDGSAQAATERVVRRLQVPRGRDRLIGQISRAIDNPVDGDRDEHASGPDRQSQLQLALGLLARLKSVFDALPDEATPAEWAVAWQELANQVGLVQTISEPDRSNRYRTTIPDAVAWERLPRALGADDRLASWLGTAAKKLDRKAALAVLIDTLRNSPEPSNDDESGRVRVLSASSARALKIPYLFFAGLAEQSFPQRDRDDRLYGEAERRRLIGEKLPLVDHSERNREEMLLFYEVMTRATRRLYLSYPALDEAAQPLSPSPYLEEVEQACGPDQIRRTEVPDLSPVPGDEEPMSATEFRVKAVATALAGNVSLLAGLVRQEGASATATNVLAGLQLSGQRRSRTRFGAFEGVLGSSAAKKLLAARFSRERTFSATELEGYAFCPYRFFVEQVLAMEPPEELTLAVDYSARGRLMHELLAEFHRRLNELHGGPTSPSVLDDDEYRKMIDDVLGELLGRRRGSPMANVLGEVDRRLCVRWAADYREQHHDYDALWHELEIPIAPARFEASFGRASQNPDSHATPLELKTPDGTVHISGRIDRIDLGRAAGQTVLNVIDYKTGVAARFSPQAMIEGTALQLPLYALAAERIVMADRGAVSLQAGYWHIRNKGYRPKEVLATSSINDGRLEPNAEWQSLENDLAETVAALVDSIQCGRFPVYSADEECTRACPFSTVCRINQVRAVEKTCLPSPGNH